SDLFDARAFRRHIALLLRLDFIQQQPASEETVQSLLSRGLAFDLQAGGSVEQHHTRRAFVDVLAAVPARTNKRLFDVPFPHPQRGHTLRQLVFFVRAYRKCAHGRSLAHPPLKGKGAKLRRRGGTERLKTGKSASTCSPFSCL